MNMGYYKLSKYQGAKCHNDLTFYFRDQLKDWTFRAAHHVADMYSRNDSGWSLDIGGKHCDVVQTDYRKRITIEARGVSDRLSAQIDQVISVEGKKYFLDWKFTKCEDDVERIIDDARKQIAYYAWVIGDSDVVGGAYIICGLQSNNVLSSGVFDFDVHETERSFIRRLQELPGYEGIGIEEIRRV